MLDAANIPEVEHFFTPEQMQPCQAEVQMRFLDTAEVFCPACSSSVPFLCRDEDNSHFTHPVRAGDIGVCTACGTAVIFQGPQEARPLTQTEEARLTDEARRILDEAQSATR